MQRFIALAVAFFGKVHSSVPGFVNPEELFRAIVAAFGSGFLVSALTLAIQSVQTHAATIFPDPEVAGLASVVLTLILDLLRRQNQGVRPTP